MRQVTIWIQSNGKGRSSVDGLEPCRLTGELSVNRKHRMAGGSQEWVEGGTRRQDEPLAKETIQWTSKKPGN